MLAQLVERALSMCKVRSSTLLHSTNFFCQVFFVFCVGAAAQKATTLFFDDDRIYLFLYAKEERALFFFRVVTNSFSSKSPFP